MGDYEDLLDDLPPSLALLESITSKIFIVFFLSGFSYSMVLLIKQVDYEFMCIFGMLAKGLLTGEYNNKQDNFWYTSKFAGDEHNYLEEELKPKLSPRRRRLPSLTYLGTPYPKGLKHIVQTPPTGLHSSIMPMNKPELKKTLLLSGALISRRVIEV